MADTEQSLADSGTTQAAQAETQIQQPAAQDLPQGSAPQSNEAPEDDAESLLALLPEDDGLEEVEWEGEKHKIPAKLKSALMAHADYTRKTQEVAQQRAQIEQRAAEIQRQAEFQQQHVQEVAAIVSIDNQLAEYDKINWAELIAQNAQQAMLLDQQRRELQGKKAQLVQAVTQKQHQAGFEAQRMTARRIEETQRELARDIKGWSPEVAGKLTEYGRKAGFPAEVLSPAAPAAFVKTLHKAMQWDQLLAQRTAKPAASPSQPATRVGARTSPAVKDQEQMSPDEWRKHRESEIAKRRGKR